MRLKNKILLILVILIGGLIFFCNTSKAATYLGDGYSVDIPTTYTVTKTNEKLEASKSGGLTMFQIQSSKQENNNMVISEEYIKYIVQEFQSQLGENFKLISNNLIEQNGCKGLDLKYRQTKNGIYVYVDLYQFVSDNYIYTLAFGSTSQSYLTSAEKNGIVKSFKIKDTVKSSNGIPFADVSSNSWFYDAVEYVYNNNIIKGTNDYTFAPNQNLTRGMIVTILHRMEGYPKQAGNCKFPDVQNTKDYYYEAVKWATAKKIVSGYETGKFGPNDPVTREQLAVILKKYTQYKGRYKVNQGSLNKFKDGNKVSNFAINEMKWAVGAKIITGTKEGTINPQGKATRAEVASMLYKYCLNVK